MANLPDIPQKVPSTDDPRVVKALLEAANIGTNAGMALMPLGPVGVAPALVQRIAASRMAQAAKRFFQPRTASAPYEHIPGASTGLLPDLLRADPKTKLEFSRRAPWTDERGYDLMYSDIGMPGEPTVQGTGHYRNSQGMVENQPVFIARPGIGPGAEAAFDAVEATRGLMGMQEATAWHTMSPPGKIPTGVSFDVILGRPPTPSEMIKLDQIAQQYPRFGLKVANSAHGLSMLGLADNVSPELASQLRPWLEYQVRQIVPEAKVTQGLHQGNLIDFTKDSAIAKANEGQGLATRLWEDRMRRLQDVDPVRYDRLVNSPGVKQKAAADLERLEAYGGRGDRLDYEKFLGIIEKGGLKGLLDHVARYGYQGLPVVAVGGALPVIVGKNGSPDEL